MKPFTQEWWNTLANKALKQARYNIKYTSIASYCWYRAEIKESYETKI